MSIVMQPDEGRPAKADANAGQKTRTEMTPEEKERQQQRLLDTPDEVKREAFKSTSKFIVGKIFKWGFNFKQGPFCFEEMNGDAVNVIAWECYTSLFYGDRRWPEHVPLDVTMRQIARSMMDHIISKYLYRKSHPTIEIDNENISNAEEKEIEAAAGMASIEMGMRGLGYEIAFKLVKNNELFTNYLKALQEGNSYDLIADKMKIKPNEVLRIEKELLLYLNNC